MHESRKHEQHKTPRHTHLLEWISQRSSELNLEDLTQYFLFLKDSPTEALQLINAIERYSPSSISQLIQASKDENFPIPVLIHQDQKVVFVNKATLELGSLSASQDLIGHHILSFIPEEDHELMTSRMMQLIKTGVSSDPIAQRIKFPDGHTKTVVLYGMLTSFSGKPAVQIFFQNINQQESRVLERERQLDLSENLNKALIQLVSDEKTETVIPSVMEIAINGFEADRVYIFKNFLSSDNTLYTAQKYELVREGVSDEIDNANLTFVPYSEMGFQRWEAILGRGECLYGNVLDFPDCEQELLLSQDIQSILVAPIFVDDQFWGFLGLDACKWERPWSRFEQSTLKNLALAIGGYLARMSSLSETEASGMALQKAQDLGKMSSCSYLVESGSWYFSDAFLKTFGPIPERASEYHVAGRKVLSPSDHKQLFQGWDTLLRSDQSAQIEGELAFNVKGLPPRYYTYLLENEVSQGRTFEINAIFRDITKEKQAMMALMDSHQKLERVQKIGKVGFWEYDFHTQKIWASDILLDILNLKASEGDALSFLTQSVLKEDFLELSQKVEMELSKGKPFEFIQQLHLKNGEKLFFEIYGEITTDKDGNPSKLSGTSKDITEKEDTEQRFKTTNTNFAAILESTEDLIFSLDREFCLTAYNSSFKSLIKRWNNQVITSGVNLLSLLSVGPEVDNINSQIARIRLAMTGQASTDLVKVTSSPGDVTHYEILMNPIWDENKEVQGVSVFGKDISLQIEREKEIKSLNKALEKKVAIRTEALEKTNKELEAFAYSVSHDLRTPLRHLNGYSSLLRSRGNKILDKESLEYLDFIESSSKKMNNLIEDLLEYSRLGRKEIYKSKISLKPIVDGLIDYFLSQNPETEIEFELALDLEIFADHILVETILTNLISNAIKYRKKDQRAHIRILTESTELGVKLIIIDQGIGFDLKYLDQVFGIFKRLHTDDEYEGSGIGLANVSRIMHRHGGTVEAYSERGKGARFTCFFPDSTFF